MCRSIVCTKGQLVSNPYGQKDRRRWTHERMRIGWNLWNILTHVCVTDRTKITLASPILSPIGLLSSHICHQFIFVWFFFLKSRRPLSIFSVDNKGWWCPGCVMRVRDFWEICHQIHDSHFPSIRFQMLITKKKEKKAAWQFPFYSAFPSDSFDSMQSSWLRCLSIWFVWLSVRLCVCLTGWLALYLCTWLAITTA